MARTLLLSIRESLTSKGMTIDVWEWAYDHIRIGTFSSAAIGKETMIAFRRILCVTDLSEQSLRALEAARQLAGRFSAELVLLHVVDQLPVSPSDKTKIPQSSVEVAPTGQIPLDVTRHLEELIKGAEETMDRVVGERTTEQEQVRLEVREGFSPVEIVKAVGEMGVDLIVMAARSQREPARNRAGSITQQVARDAPVSVLIVR